MLWGLRGIEAMSGAPVLRELERELKARVYNADM